MAELGSLGALLQQAEDGLGEEKQVDITVDMLDYDYVEKCSDRNRLKGILERLQGGGDGHYPDVSSSLFQFFVLTLALYHHYSLTIAHYLRAISLFITFIFYVLYMNVAREKN